jgi:hypothetical protein
MRCHSVGLWYAEPSAVSNAIGYAMHRSRSADAVIRVYDATGNVIETHEHKGDFQRVVKCSDLNEPPNAASCLLVRVCVQLGG